MIVSWLVFWSSLFLSTSAYMDKTTHAIYLSMTEVEITDKEVTFSVKLFSDDLRDALKNYNRSSFKPADLSQFFSINEEIAQQYINQHLLLRTKKSTLIIQLIDHSVEGDAHFLQLKSQLPENTAELTLNADFLMELFPTQKNIVQVIVRDSKQYLQFNYPAEEQSINLSN